MEEVYQNICTYELTGINHAWEALYTKDNITNNDNNDDTAWLH